MSYINQRKYINGLPFSAGIGEGVHLVCPFFHSLVHHRLREAVARLVSSSEVSDVIVEGLVTS